MLLVWSRRLSCAFYVTVVVAAGCGSSASVLQTSDGGVDVPAADVSPAVPCGTRGAGRLRVTLSLDSTLDRGQADVWLATRCGSDQATVQVVRWDGSTAQSLDGLGPGSWQVFASSYVAAGAWSPRVTLEGAATAAVTVTLPNDAPLLARYDSAVTIVPTDAGVTDAGLPGAWRGVAAITDPLLGTVGWLECFASAAGAGSLAVQVVVRNTCVSAQCPALSLAVAEARTLDGDTPVDLSQARYGSPEVALGVGQSASLPQPINLRGVVPDARHTLQVAIFGHRGAIGQGSNP